LANLPDFLEKITLMPSSYRVSYYTFFNVNPEEPCISNNHKKLKPISAEIKSIEQVVQIPQISLVHPQNNQ